MADVSKVEYGGRTLVDLTNDTVTPETLAEGATAHGANGERIVGTMPTHSVPAPTQFTNILTHASTEIRLNQTHNGTARNGAICVIIDLAALGINTTRKVEFRMRGFVIDLSYPNIMRSTDKSTWSAWKAMNPPAIDNHGDMSATISSVNPATYPYLLVMFRNKSSAATLDTYAGAILTINEPIGNGGYVG
jgi:hypothetical protein